MATRARRLLLGGAPAVRVDPEEARALVDGGALLVDVRRHDDAAAPPAGALRIPPDEIPEHLSSLPRGVPILLTCT